MKGKRYSRKEIFKKRIFVFLIFVISCITFVLSMFNIIKYFIQNNRNKKIAENISESIVISEGHDEDKEKKYKIDFAKLESINSDIIGFLKVNGTDIETVVVKGEDNSYYLNHNFEKEANVAGWVFADYRNNLDGEDKNIIIYGHNMRNGTMFGTLEKILNKEWQENKENRIIYFVTEKETIQYEVFSVYEIKDEDYYITTKFESGRFAEFINTISKRSVFDFGVNVKETDSVLTLSTCANNSKYRVVLHAKKVNNIYKNNNV